MTALASGFLVAPLVAEDWCDAGPLTESARLRHCLPPKPTPQRSVKGHCRWWFGDFLFRCSLDFYHQRWQWRSSMPSSPISDPARTARDLRMVAAATRRCLPRVLCISVLARGSLQDSEWVQGVNVSLLNRQISSIRRDRRRYQGHDRRRTV